MVVPVFVVGYKTSNQLINSFGCFDDCHVFSTAYFMIQGKTIYSEIFFNHNPLMPYFSYIIQLVYEPRSIYELLLRHRQIIFFASVFLNILLLIRFRYRALGFILLFELTKFYTFGNRFLPEAIIVYPLVYLFGLGWEKVNGRKIIGVDYIFSALAVWFVIFMREPYVPLALFLYACILWKSIKRLRFISLGLFLIFSIVTFFSLPIKDFYFNVVTFNLSETVGQEISRSSFFGLDFLKTIFYPFFILFPLGSFGFYREILIFESIFFVYLVLLNFRRLQLKVFFFLFLALGLANIRFTDPGVTFYSAYHMNVWYGIFIFTIMLLFSEIKKTWFKFVGVSLYIGILLFSISGNSIIWDKLDQQEQLLTNYGQQMLHAQMIKEMSEPTDTLFLDGWDELIYSQAQLPSSYKYSHYTSQMPQIQMYQDARILMFKNNPPVFYYGTCREDVGQKLPNQTRKLYVHVYHMNKPTCLYVLKTKYEKIKVTDENVTFHEK